MQSARFHIIQIIICKVTKDNLPKQITICDRGEVYDGLLIDLTPLLNILDILFVLVNIAE